MMTSLYLRVNIQQLPLNRSYIYHNNREAKSLPVVVCSELKSNNFGQLFEQVGERPPQLGIVFLQGLDLLQVHAIGVGMDRHLVQIVGAPPLERNKLLDGGEVNMEDIAVEGHLADIGTHVSDARLVHARPDGLQLVGAHPHIEGHVPDALSAHRSSFP